MWLEAAETWCYRIMLRISWKSKMIYENILDELRTGRELLVRIIKRKMVCFGHACTKWLWFHKDLHSRNDAGGNKKGHPRMQYTGNINKSTITYLEKHVMMTDDMTAWRIKELAQLRRITSEMITLIRNLWQADDFFIQLAALVVS